MNDDDRRAEIRQIIKDYTTANTTSRALARQRLIEEGIYNKDGSLKVAFGGVAKPRKAKTAA